jgi:hypothetical protein
VPLLIVPALVLLAVIVGIALMPIGLVQRYRAGTARRVARSWLTNLNIGALALSVLLFLGSAALATVWIPNALTFSLAGLAAGSLCGMLGLALTKWEPSPQRLHYTPNRFLVLTITLVVIARLIYGAWRLSEGWGTNTSWLRESGVAGSMAAGALVLGYTFTYWIGLRRQITRLRAT